MDTLTIWPTSKRLSSGQNPPRIPEFYTLTKIHKNTPVGRPIVSGSSGPTERISCFVESLLQPIAQKQESYIKDTTHFINFIENTPLPDGAVLATLDVCSLKQLRNLHASTQLQKLWPICNHCHWSTLPFSTTTSEELINLYSDHDQAAPELNTSDINNSSSSSSELPIEWFAAKINGYYKNNLKIGHLNINSIFGKSDVLATSSEWFHHITIQIQKLSTVYPGLKTKRDSPVQGRRFHIRLRTAQIRESLFHGGINLFFSHKLGPSFLNFKLKWCLCVWVFPVSYH